MQVGVRGQALRKAWMSARRNLAACLQTHLALMSCWKLWQNVVGDSKGKPSVSDGSIDNMLSWNQYISTPS